METLTTGEVAERAGVNIETVRYYERRGLIPEPPRRASGYRQYSDEHVERIKFIKRAQELGFTLNEIDDLLTLRVDPETDCGDVRRRAQAKITEVEEKIRDLERIKDALTQLALACKGKGPTSECPILDAMRDGEVFSEAPE